MPTGLRPVSFSPVESHLHTFGGLEHDVAAEHRKLLLPALDPLIRLQDPYYGVCHFRHREVLTCKVTSEEAPLRSSLGNAAVGCLLTDADSRTAIERDERKGLRYKTFPSLGHKIEVIRKARRPWWIDVFSTLQYES